MIIMQSFAVSLMYAHQASACSSSSRSFRSNSPSCTCTSSRRASRRPCTRPVGSSRCSRRRWTSPFAVASWTSSSARAWSSFSRSPWPCWFLAVITFCRWIWRQCWRYIFDATGNYWFGVKYTTLLRYWLQFFQKELPGRVEADVDNFFNLVFSMKINTKRMKKLEKEYSDLRKKEQEEMVELRVRTHSQ